MPPPYILSNPELKTFLYLVTEGRKLQTNEKLTTLFNNPNRSSTGLVTQPRSALTSQRRPPVLDSHLASSRQEYSKNGIR